MISYHAFLLPNVGVAEDPVTGSSHSSLIPFWSERLQKKQMIAKQLSPRGGTLYCENLRNRVTLAVLLYVIPRQLFISKSAKNKKSYSQ